MKWVPVSVQETRRKYCRVACRVTRVEASGHDPSVGGRTAYRVSDIDFARVQLEAPADATQPEEMPCLEPSPPNETGRCNSSRLEEHRGWLTRMVWSCTHGVLLGRYRTSSGSRSLLRRMSPSLRLWYMPPVTPPR